MLEFPNVNAVDEVVGAAAGVKENPVEGAAGIALETADPNEKAGFGAGDVAPGAVVDGGAAEVNENPVEGAGVLAEATDPNEKAGGFDEGEVVPNGKGALKLNVGADGCLGLVAGKEAVDGFDPEGDNPVAAGFTVPKEA